MLRVFFAVVFLTLLPLLLCRGGQCLCIGISLETGKDLSYVMLSHQIINYFKWWDKKACFPTTLPPSKYFRRLRHQQILSCWPFRNGGGRKKNNRWGKNGGTNIRQLIIWGGAKWWEQFIISSGGKNQIRMAGGKCVLNTVLPLQQKHKAPYTTRTVM